MIILGLNAYHWDSSAALIIEGKLIHASEEERFNRIKHFSGFPIETVIWMLRKEGLTLSDIDIITVPSKALENIFPKLRSLRFRKAINGLKRQKNRLGIKADLIKRLNESGHSDLLGDNADSVKVKYLEHHNCHVYSALAPSEFKQCAYLTLDAFGDYNSSKIGTYIDGKMSLISKTIYPHSIGIFYTAMTQFLGFHNVGDEYKVMGLSPYGDSRNYVELISDMILFREGKFRLNLKYFTHMDDVEMSTDTSKPLLGSVFSEEVGKKLGIPSRHSSEPIKQVHMDIAAAIQKITELLIIDAADYVWNQTGQRNLILSGGVAQNSVVNGKILSKTKFESLFVSAASHDAGLAVGSAVGYYIEQGLSFDKTSFKSAYTGYEATEQEVNTLLRSLDYRFVEHLNDEELTDSVSNLLADGMVVGWFQGKAEYGPRALGNRSILTNPARSDAKELINSKIKRRESFRPFAPSVLAEFQEEWFDDSQPSIYMERVIPFKKHKRALVPAVVHEDGSGRIQTVTKDINQLYHQLIFKFNEKTGVPMLLNTSFNENEPVVNTPLEAYECFKRTDMDILVINKVVIYKK